MSHNVTFNIVARDFSQGYANLIPLDDPALLDEIYPAAEALHRLGLVKSIEVNSGAQPQVDLITHKVSPLEVIESIREAAPTADLRTLMRGPFGVRISPPMHADDLEILHRHFAAAAGARKGGVIRSRSSTRRATSRKCSRRSPSRKSSRRKASRFRWRWRYPSARAGTSLMRFSSGRCGRRSRRERTRSASRTWWASSPRSGPGR